MPKTVAEVMTHDVVVVQPQTPVKEAIRILAEQRIAGMPVVDEDSKLVGVISETDLMWQETGVDPPVYITFLDSIILLKNPADYDRDLHKALGQSVGEVMTSDPIAVTPEEGLREAAKLMHEKKIRRLPVVDNTGKVLGILTRGDIVRAMAADLD